MSSIELTDIYVSLRAESEREATILKNRPVRDREVSNVIICLYIHTEVYS